VSAMTGYLVSLLMGLAVGVAYGLVQVRSPAPPMIALIGLFGMVLGEQAVDLAKRRFVRPAQTSLLHEVDGAHASLRPGRTEQNWAPCRIREPPCRLVAVDNHREISRAVGSRLSLETPSPDACQTPGRLNYHLIEKGETGKDL
jgi:XapX domain-containing protein